MAGIAVLVVGSVVLGGLAVALSTDTESEPPPIIVPNRTEAPATPSGPFLTGAEAAAKAEGTLRQAVVNATGRQDLSYACDAEDYNSRTHQWIVGCLVPGPQNAIINFRFTVDDRTGAVSVVK
jgi:hypothetical protein